MEDWKPQVTGGAILNNGIIRAEQPTALDARFQMFAS